MSSRMPKATCFAWKPLRRMHDQDIVDVEQKTLIDNDLGYLRPKKHRGIQAHPTT